MRVLTSLHIFFFSSRRRHTRLQGDWSSDVCSSDLGAGLVKSPQTICYEILEEARSLARANEGESFKQTTLRVNPEVARALRTTERDVLTEIEDYLGPVDITGDEHVHQEQFDFAFI